jgi:hypothetical protein
MEYLVSLDVEKTVEVLEKISAREESVKKELRSIGQDLEEIAESEKIKHVIAQIKTVTDKLELEDGEVRKLEIGEAINQIKKEENYLIKEEREKLKKLKTQLEAVVKTQGTIKTVLGELKAVSNTPPLASVLEAVKERVETVVINLGERNVAIKGIRSILQEAKEIIEKAIARAKTGK